jgi:predicted XRE-type DNA-binding protein
MPYKDPEIAKKKAMERKKRWQSRERLKRIESGLPADGRGRHGNHQSGTGHHRWNGKQIKNSDGYIKVRVGVGHKYADLNGYAYEHVIVWASNGFDLPDGMIIHHRNGDKGDNRIENLECMSRTDHNAEHGNKKLSKSDVVTIRALYQSGVYQKQIANHFGVAHQTISKIVRGEARKNDPGPMVKKNERDRDSNGHFV